MRYTVYESKSEHVIFFERLSSSLIVAAALLCGTAGAEEPVYRVTSLGTLSEDENHPSEAFAVNNMGQVVGWSGTLVEDEYVDIRDRHQY
jgi:hypothetical protein